MVKVPEEEDKFQPSPAREHPLFSGSPPVGLISGDNPRFIPQSSGGHEVLAQHLKAMGLKYEPTEGRYETPERSYLVYGPTREQMYELGKKFGQEAVIYSSGGRHELMYTNGQHAGRFHPSLPHHEFFRDPPEDYYTKLPEHGYIRLKFDADHLLPARLGQAHAVDALETRARSGKNTMKSMPEFAQALAQRLRKFTGKTMSPIPHPNAYDWHDGHSQHALPHLGGGILVSRGLAKADAPHPHMDGSRPGQVPAPAANDQAAGTGASTYAKFALPYGHLTPGQTTDLTHYPYHGKAQAVDQLVKDHGYQTYYAGGRYGRPDLVNRNYNTKHLMVYDPTPASGGDFGHEQYTDSWRKTHELAHALTYPEVNKIYGEGRRIGKLGHHRNLREGLRAVHWEWLAAHKQRELSRQLGIEIPDETFNKELNTIMHDAAHRAVTGQFTEPSSEGFNPHPHQVPLETALGLVREHAHNLGLVGDQDLIKKSEGNSSMAEKEYTVPEIRQALAKTLKDRIEIYGKELEALAKREQEASLSKATKDSGHKWKCNVCEFSGNPAGATKCQNPLENCKAKRGTPSPLDPAEWTKNHSKMKKGDVGMPLDQGGLNSKLSISSSEPSPNPQPAPAAKEPAPAPRPFIDTRTAPRLGEKHRHLQELRRRAQMKKGEDKPDPKSCPKCGENHGGVDHATAVLHEPWPKVLHPSDKKSVKKGELCKDDEECGACGGPLESMGALGNRQHFKCRNCGMQSSSVPEKAKPEPKKDTKKAEIFPVHKIPTPRKIKIPGGGAGGKITAIRKDDVPMAKPPGKNPMAVPKSTPTAGSIAPKLGKAALPGTRTGDALQAAHAAAPAPAPAGPTAKMPSPADHATRAASLNSFMPPGKFSPPAGTDHLQAPLKPPLPAAAAAPTQVAANLASAVTKPPAAGGLSGLRDRARSKSASTAPASIPAPVPAPAKKPGLGT